MGLVSRSRMKSRDALTSGVIAYKTEYITLPASEMAIELTMTPALDETAANARVESEVRTVKRARVERRLKWEVSMRKAPIWRARATKKGGSANGT
jgi:hypothetical protein